MNRGIFGQPPDLVERDRARFSASPFDYLPRGRYVDYLERLVGIVGTDHVHVGNFEELVADADVLTRLDEHPGVDATFRASRIGALVNASDDGDECLTPPIVDQLRNYVREPNERRAGFLGRALCWP